MGDIEKISVKLELSDPKGWDPKNEQFNLPFAVELRENFHIHWQDLRLEMLPEDFENFHNAIHDAYLAWNKDGKPTKFENVKRYGFWPGEEDYDFHKDRDRPRNIDDKPCHHFRKFPRTESGKQFFDSVFQIELQKAGQYHIHYKNLRIDLGKKRLESMANAMHNSIEQ